MRLFIAIDVCPEIKAAMSRLAHQIEVPHTRVRWSSANQIHLTLKFIGEVGDDLLKPIGNVLERTAQSTPCLDLAVRGTGCFPAGGPVRIIWVGGQSQDNSLVTVAQRLETDLEKLGITPEERTFSEHFTIGRVKFDHSRGKLRAAVQAAKFEGGQQRVAELVLYQSLLSPLGAEYTPLLRAALASG